MGSDGSDPRTTPFSIPPRGPAGLRLPETSHGSAAVSAAPWAMAMSTSG
jgi:hypothetical protein